MTQELPRRSRIWSLSTRSSVQGPDSAAALSMICSTVGGKRGRMAELAAEPDGVRARRSLCDRFRFRACDPLAAGSVTRASPAGAEEDPAAASPPRNWPLSAPERGYSNAAVWRDSRLAGGTTGNTSCGNQTDSVANAPTLRATGGACSMDSQAMSPARWSPATNTPTPAFALDLGHGATGPIRP